MVFLVRYIGKLKYATVLPHRKKHNFISQMHQILFREWKRVFFVGQVCHSCFEQDLEIRRCHWSPFFKWFEYRTVNTIVNKDFFLSTRSISFFLWNVNLDCGKTIFDPFLFNGLEKDHSFTCQSCLKRTAAATGVQSGRVRSGQVQRVQSSNHYSFSNNKYHLQLFRPQDWDAQFVAQTII